MIGEAGFSRKYFKTMNCERCGASILSRSISLFTHDVICIPCRDREDVAKAKLMKLGKTTKELDGCGYIPESVKGILFPKQKPEAHEEKQS